GSRVPARHTEHVAERGASALLAEGDGLPAIWAAVHAACRVHVRDVVRDHVHAQPLGAQCACGDTDAVEQAHGRPPCFVSLLLPASSVLAPASAAWSCLLTAGDYWPRMTVRSVARRVPSDCDSAWYRSWVSTSSVISSSIPTVLRSLRDATTSRGA